MAKLFLRRIGNVLHADGSASVDTLSKLPLNKTLKAEINKPRNARHSRLYWEMCHRIAEAVGAEKDTVSDTLKVATGHCTWVQTKTYGKVPFPKSISFAALDQQAFSEFFERCLVTITSEWGIARSDILAVLSDLLPETKT